MTKQLAAIAAAVMTTLLALAVLWQFRIVVIYLVISLVLAAVLRPLVSRLAGRGIVARVAWILLYLAVLGSCAVLLFAAGEAAIGEVQQLVRTLSAQDAWTLPLWLEGSAFQQTLVAQLPPPSMIFEAMTGDQGQLVLPAILDLTQGIGSVLSGVLVVLFLSLYWSINQNHFERLWLSLLPSGQRRQARDVWQTVESDIGAYIHGQIILSLLVGLLLGLGFSLLGSPYPALLALVGALASLLPVVGPVLVIISVLSVGLLSSVQLSLLTTLYALLVLTALAVWVKPRLFKRNWDNPVLTVVLLLAMADAFGLLGIILAPPLSVVCQILWSRLVSRRTVAEAAIQVSDLQERYTRVLDTITAMAGPPPALVTSSMARLNQLIAKAEPILQADQPAGEPAAGLPADLAEPPLQPPGSLAADSGPPVATIAQRSRR
jgi:predicted PurR-regulated permease PerM